VTTSGVTGAYQDVIAAIKTAAARDPETSYRAAGYTRRLKKQGGSLVGLCPFHGESDPSFNIALTNGDKPAGLWFCHGCKVGGTVIDFYMRREGVHKLDRQTVADLAGKLGISIQDGGGPEAVYRYHKPDGSVAFEVCRFAGKKFRQRRPDGTWNLKGVERVLYRLPELVAARDALVYVTEGEKDADCLAGEGLVATTNAGGAGKWRAEYGEGLQGRNVVVIPDKDDVGRQHAEQVARSVHGLAASVKVVNLPSLPEKGDVSDWLTAGHTREELETLADRAPEWTPGEASAEEKCAVGQMERLRLDADEKRLEIISSQAWAALLEANTPARLFLHAGRPARFEADGDAVAALQELTPERLRYELARAAEWWARRKVNGVWHDVPAMPPKDVVADMLAHPVGALRLPPVDRIVRAPVFAADGTLQAASGYHPAGRVIVCPPEGLHVPDPPTAPTDHDIKAAVVLIDELITDFPFVNGADRAAAFALLLVPFCRDMIDGPTPLHLFEAPAAGTGKGLLAAVALIPAVGDDLGTMTQGRDEDEWRKRISTCLREGKAAILIDNVTHALDSGVLSSALTTTLWSDRLLGTLDPLNLPVRCAWVATGNNPTLSTEIARRSIRCRLDSKTDRPFQRDPATFRHPSLREWAREHRAALIGAALTLVQAWLAAGRPSPAVRPLGSYESWTRVIGGILHRAGIEQFLDNLDDLYERADSEGAVWRRFVEAWWDDYEDREVGVADLYAIAAEMEDFDLGKGQERSQKTVLGKGLARRADMVLGRFRIEAAGAKKRLAQWRLTPTRPGPPEVENGVHGCT